MKPIFKNKTELEIIEAYALEEDAIANAKAMLGIDPL